MPKFRVKKSIEINIAAAKAREVLQDYKAWDIWSPWLCMEPDATLNFEGTAAVPGHAYRWQGDMIGSGRMELTSIDGDTDRMDLAFLKPFKSKAKVWFVTTAIDENTCRVSWHMDSSLPFFLFFMTSTMTAMIGMDYDRGLTLLKEYLETGKVTSQTEIIGVVDVPATHYKGVSAASQLADISSSMEGSFAQVFETAQGKITDSFCGAIYNDMNIKTQHCKYTAFAPVAEADATGCIAECRALKVVHTGSYQHLGCAWATINTYQRHNKFKQNKKIAPFELYRNDPANTQAKDLITEIYMPVNT